MKNGKYFERNAKHLKNKVYMYVWNKLLENLVFFHSLTEFSVNISFQNETFYPNEVLVTGK